MPSILDNTLFPNKIDDIACVEPERLYCSVFREADDIKPSEISFGVFANAVNRFSWWLEEVLGKTESHESPTVGYIGSADLRYILAAVGGMKTGYKAWRRSFLEGCLTDSCRLYFCHRIIQSPHKCTCSGRQNAAFSSLRKTTRH